jgi:hypothetical protein
MSKGHFFVSFQFNCSFSPTQVAELEETLLGELAASEGNILENTVCWPIIFIVFFLLR